MIGLVINPIAGMGGRVGLKGTDNLYYEAKRRGAEKISTGRARKFLENLKIDERFLVPSKEMGENVIKEFGFDYKVIYNTPPRTTADDTKKVVKIFMDWRVDLIVFVGGDGTARDVASVVNSEIPVLGIPSGVKMYSAVFSLTPEIGAKIVEEFFNGNTMLVDSEVMDIDEDAYRKNQLKIKLYSYMRVPHFRDYVQSSKSEYGGDAEGEKEEIGEFFRDNIAEDTLYILGAGTTTKKIGEILGVDKTLLGVDAYFNGKMLKRDLNEREILKLIDEYKNVRIVITPIGSQGFIFGRGNLQISERVLKKLEKKDIIIVATPTKLRDLKKLRIDLDNCNHLRGYYKILCGYGRYKLMKIE